MKNSVSDQSFYIHSEEEDEERVSVNAADEEENNGYRSDSSSGDDDASEVASPPQNKPSSYTTSWPQSYRYATCLFIVSVFIIFQLRIYVWIYKWTHNIVFSRQSIDMYSSVASPNIGFLGTPTLSRMGSSFFTSSLTRRHTPEILPSVVKPLLDQDQQKQQQEQRRSSHALLPPISRRRSSLRKVVPDDKISRVSHELPLPNQSSYGQAVVNGDFSPPSCY